MAEWIRIRVRLSMFKAGSPGGPATPDQVGALARQLAADAVYGSFGEFRNDYWSSRWELPPDQLVHVNVDPDTIDGRDANITMSLNSDLYDVANGGLQHFLGVLAGDLFFLRIPG